MAIDGRLLELALQKVSDRRILINGSAKRAGELARGARPLLPINPQDEMSHLDIALLEIAEGKLPISTDWDE